MNKNKLIGQMVARVHFHERYMNKFGCFGTIIGKKGNFFLIKWHDDLIFDSHKLHIYNREQIKDFQEIMQQWKEKILSK